MSAAAKALALIAAVAAIAGCDKSPPPPDNNMAAIDNIAATPTDIDTLPPDESVAPAEEPTTNDTPANGY